KTSEPLPLAHVVSWIRDTAAGLANACEHGVVHHDIKPGNIMLDQEGKAKICDFGIAQIVSGNKVDSATELTSCWVSPHYVSPEKIVSGTEDYRGDIYSLGATFYHLVTGYTPFTENDVDELLRLRVNNDPMAPQHHRKDLPESLSDLILSMISRDPEKRPSYATILSVLDKYLAHPVSAARPAAKRAPGAAGAKRPAAPRRPAGTSNAAAELARKQAARQKAASSPAVMTMKIISTILTIVTIFAVGVWLLNETGNLDNHIGSLPRFMQKDKKETKAEKKLNTKILNCFQSGLSADAQMESEKILNDPAKDSSGYKNQAMLQAAFAAFLNTDLREIKDGTRQKTGKQYTEVLAAERENSMTDLDKIRAEDNYQLLQYLAGTYGVGELEDNDLHFTRGDDFGTKRAMADFLLFLTESDQPAADEIEPVFNTLKDELEKCKASWLYDAFMDRLPYWEQALFSGNGKIEEIEPLFRSFIKEDRKWGFDQAEKKHKFSSVPQKKAVVQLTEKGEVIG
ncbi:MAG: serine/threonine protein kinase, partial [Lentisphaeria bacterium]|nr:serine/threonine protein kinase [Lentisphaeria bacterium]